MQVDDPRHGSRSGYVAHRRDAEDACAPCKRAEAAYQGARYRSSRPKSGSHTRAMVTCTECMSVFDAASRSHTYCSSACREVARNRRRREKYAGPTGRRPAVLMGIAYRYGMWAPKKKAISCEIGVGVLATCPNCDFLMFATSPSDRTCHQCATQVQLNAEEVEALTHAGR